MDYANASVVRKGISAGRDPVVRQTEQEMFIWMLNTFQKEMKMQTTNQILYGAKGK